MDGETPAHLRMTGTSNAKSIQLRSAASKGVVGYFRNHESVSVRCNCWRMRCRHDIGKIEAQDFRNRLRCNRFCNAKRLRGCNLGSHGRTIIISLDSDANGPGGNFENGIDQPWLHTAKNEGCADHRVPCKRHFGSAVENADSCRIRGVDRRQNEGCFTQIEFGSHCLHSGWIQPLGAHDHGERISAKTLVREYINSEKFKHSMLLPQTAAFGQAYIRSR